MDSWRVDETYIKIKGVWMYLYRAVDSQGNTLEFFLRATRDAQAAKHFLRKALNSSHTVSPRVVTVDKNAAYPKALQEMKAVETRLASCELRQSKYLNNLIEQDHRFIKHLFRNRHVREVSEGDRRSQVAFTAELFGVGA